MTNQPWGPHGPEAPPNTVRPNPTAPGSPHQLLGAGDAPLPVAPGGGSGFFAAVIVSLVMVVLVFIPMVCLYPLTALASILAGVGTYLLAVRVLPADGGDVAALLGVVVGAIALWKVYRLEYRLAQQPPIRLTRHVVRLLLLSVWVIPVMQLATGATAPTTSTRYILATVSNPETLVGFLTRPQNLLIWAAAIAGLHFLLWTDNRFRRWWHYRLIFVGLK